MKKLLNSFSPSRLYVVDVYDEWRNKLLMTFSDVKKEDTLLSDFRFQIDNYFREHKHMTEVTEYRFIRYDQDVGKSEILGDVEKRMKLSDIWQGERGNTRKRCSIQFRESSVRRKPQDVLVESTFTEGLAINDSSCNVKEEVRDSKSSLFVTILEGTLLYTFLGVIAVGTYLIPLEYDVLFTCTIAAFGLLIYVSFHRRNVFYRLIAFFGVNVSFICWVVILGFCICAHLIGYLVDDDFLFGGDEGKTFKIVLVGFLTPIFTVIAMSAILPCILRVFNMIMHRVLLKDSKKL